MSASCPECGGAVPQRALYCSPACRNRAWQREHRTAVPPAERRCDWCGRLFTPKINAARSRWCDSTCRKYADGLREAEREHQQLGPGCPRPKAERVGRHIVIRWPL